MYLGGAALDGLIVESHSKCYIYSGGIRSDVTISDVTNALVKPTTSRTGQVNRGNSALSDTGELVRRRPWRSG